MAWVPSLCVMNLTRGKIGCWVPPQSSPGFWRKKGFSGSSFSKVGEGITSITLSNKEYQRNHFVDIFPPIPLIFTDVFFHGFEDEISEMRVHETRRQQVQAMEILPIPFHFRQLSTSMTAPFLRRECRDEWFITFAASGAFLAKQGTSLKWKKIWQEYRCIRLETSYHESSDENKRQSKAYDKSHDSCQEESSVQWTLFHVFVLPAHYFAIGHGENEARVQNEHPVRNEQNAGENRQDERGFPRVFRRFHVHDVNFLKLFPRHDRWVFRMELSSRYAIQVQRSSVNVYAGARNRGGWNTGSERVEPQSDWGSSGIATLVLNTFPFSTSETCAKNRQRYPNQRTGTEENERNCSKIRVDCKNATGL